MLPFFGLAGLVGGISLPRYPLLLLSQSIYRNGGHASCTLGGPQWPSQQARIRQALAVHLDSALHQALNSKSWRVRAGARRPEHLFHSCPNVKLFTAPFSWLLVTMCAAHSCCVGYLSSVGRPGLDRLNPFRMQ